jgi:hypothetical protein
MHESPATTDQADDVEIIELITELEDVAKPGSTIPFRLVLAKDHGGELHVLEVDIDDEAA